MRFCGRGIASNFRSIAAAIFKDNPSPNMSRAQIRDGSKQDYPKKNKILNKNRMPWLSFYCKPDWLHEDPLPAPPCPQCELYSERFEIWIVLILYDKRPFRVRVHLVAPWEPQLFFLKQLEAIGFAAVYRQAIDPGAQVQKEHRGCALWRPGRAHSKRIWM